MATDGADGVTSRSRQVKIAVLGAGAGGTAVAFDCASSGHDVRLFDFSDFPLSFLKVGFFHPWTLDCFFDYFYLPSPFSIQILTTP